MRLMSGNPLTQSLSSGIGARGCIVSASETTDSCMSTEGAHGAASACWTAGGPGSALTGPAASSLPAFGASAVGATRGQPEDTQQEQRACVGPAPPLAFLSAPQQAVQEVQTVRHTAAACRRRLPGRCSCAPGLARAAGLHARPAARPYRRAGRPVRKRQPVLKQQRHS